jgi:23S rRNA pseudouridine1911/1915/1917 synthase
MVFCKDKKLNTCFARLFQDHLIQKSYIALCRGPWPSDQHRLEVNHPIGRLPTHERSRAGQGAVFGKTPSGKKAKTTFELIGSENNYHLIKATPHTGRTHQIRIHASLEGFPHVRDDLYGGNRAPHRFLLHAFALRWPKTGALQPGKFIADVPESWFPLLGETLKSILKNWSPS